MKGIILAGGSGTRLYPATKTICKQLLPIFDKPMIYYPLSVLMLAGIKDILIISTPYDLPFFQKMFEDGSNLGLNITYKEQKKPEGIAQALIIGKDFIKNDKVALILGDNIFYGHDFSDVLAKAKDFDDGAVVFGYQVNNPKRYGVVSFNKDFEAIDIEEKPKEPKSNYAVCGLYFYDSSVVDIASSLSFSNRNELEITDVNLHYLKKNKLKVYPLGRGYAWLDAGTHDSFQKASLYVQAIQERQAIKIACLEEIAFKKGFINKDQLLEQAKKYSKSDYGLYLTRNFS